jgi:hypothetical protein
MVNLQRRRGAIPGGLLFGGAVLLTAAMSLAGCSSTAVIDNIPTGLGGLPASTPARPAEPTPYLPVNALPPPRDTPPLSAEDQKKLESELVAIRDKQAASGAAAVASGDPPPAGAAAAAKTKAAAARRLVARPAEKPTQTSSTACSGEVDTGAQSRPCAPKN